MPSTPSDQTDELQIARDKQLARGVCRGDPLAIKSFCDTYLPRLYRFALVRLPGEQDADDVVQVVIANAARRIETYRGDAPLLGWLYTICRREISKHLGASARHADLVQFEENAEVAHAVATAKAPVADEPEAVSDRDELAAQVHAALDQLPAHYAQALQLKYVEGYSTKEIAGRMNMADVGVQSLLARARRAFRTQCDAAQIDAGHSDGDRG